jgi:hypothetical protein
MAQSEDSSASQQTSNNTKTTTIWAAVLCVGIIVTVAAICLVQKALRGQRNGRSGELQLPRYNNTSGLGKKTVESMPIVTFNHRKHCQSVPVPRPALLSPSDYLPKTKHPRRGDKTLALRKYFTIQNICRDSSRSDGATTRPGDSTSTACSICTEDFIEGAKLRLLPCGHFYHPQCIDPWLTDRSRTCPLW